MKWHVSIRIMEVKEVNPTFIRVYNKVVKYIAKHYELKMLSAFTMSLDNLT